MLYYHPCDTVGLSDHPCDRVKVLYYHPCDMVVLSCHPSDAGSRVVVGAGGQTHYTHGLGMEPGRSLGLKSRT